MKAILNIQKICFKTKRIFISERTESLLSFEQLWCYFKVWIIISKISFTLHPQLSHWEVAIIFHLNLTTYQLTVMTELKLVRLWSLRKQRGFRRLGGRRLTEATAGVPSDLGYVSVL